MYNNQREPISSNAKYYLCKIIETGETITLTAIAS